MKVNMGTLDRALRIVLALVIGFLYYKGIIHGTFGIVLLVFAVTFLLSAFVGFCPLYVPLKINTAKHKE